MQTVRKDSLSIIFHPSASAALAAWISYFKIVSKTKSFQNEYILQHDTLNLGGIDTNI
jgi:hypothetical protein